MDLRSIFMGLAFALMWSSAFTSARIIVLDAPPLLALSFRFLISGSFAVTLAYFLGQRIHLNRQQWRAVLTFGVCQNGLYLGLFFVAMQRIEASFAAIIASTMPLLVALAGVFIFNERLGRRAIFGLAAGFTGVAIIMFARFQGGVDGLGVILCIIGVIALAVATLMVRDAASGGNILMVVGLQMLVGCAALAIPAILQGDWHVDLSARLFLAFGYTTIVPGLAATLVWFLLVRRIGATRAASFHFLNPFFGVAIAALILSESLTLRDILGVAIIMLGIYAVQTSKTAHHI